MPQIERKHAAHGSEAPSGAPEVRLLTPLATGAVAVVQIAGPGAAALADRLFRPRSGRRLSDYPRGRFAYGDVVDEKSEPFDEGLAVQGACGSQEYVEVHLHGGIRTVQRLIQAAESLGGRFTGARREAAPLPAAWQDGPDAAFSWLAPLDLWIHGCLSQAETERAVEWLVRQRQGWQETTERWKSLLAAGRTEQVRREARTLLAEAGRLGNIWRGKSIALVGPPNAGKSTIANRLTGKRLCLVSDRPGTTRDWVDGPATLTGWPITILDTAGLRPSPDDALEHEAHRRALVKTAEASVRVVVLDVTARPDEQEEAFLMGLPLSNSDILVYNKIDLGSAPDDGTRPLAARVGTVVSISALTGEGWQRFEDALAEALGIKALQERKSVVFCAELHEWTENLVAILDRADAQAARKHLETLAERPGVPSTFEQGRGKE